MNKTPEKRYLTTDYSVQKFLLSKAYQLPDMPFLYHPHVSSSFSFQGEQMAHNLIRVAPNFHTAFNSLVSMDQQRKIMYSTFLAGKQRYLSEMQQKHFKVAEELSINNLTPQEQEKRGKPYYLSKREFNFIVPPGYYSESCPRLSTTGCTLHGMKGTHRRDISVEISKVLKCSILELDMAGAHANVAAAIIDRPDSFLEKAVAQKGFWDNQSMALKPKLDLGIHSLDTKEIRAFLKVGFYTSLNGGNPTSDARLRVNIGDNLKTALLQFNDYTHFQHSEYYKHIQDILSEYALFREVKELSDSCYFLTQENCDSTESQFVSSEEKYSVYVPSRVIPYSFDKPHKGISRVLQSFEVVLLSVLVKELVNLCAIPLSYDHDGTTVLFKGEVDPAEVASLVNQEFSKWSKHLLSGRVIQLEPKWFCFNGEVKS